MSDIFKEVEEDIRRDQARKLWDRFGPFVIGAAILIVVATAGYRGWEYWQESRAKATGDRFLSALELADDGKHAEAITELEAIAADGSGQYPVLAGFRIAAEKEATGDVDGAVAEFDKIAARGDVSSEVRALAKLRAAMLLSATAPLDEIQKRIGDLATTGNVWRHNARELLGLTAYRVEDFEKAREYFNEISDDQESPPDMRQRVQVMLALIDSRIGAPAADKPKA